MPRNGATVPAGLVTVAGVAWAPSIGISAVEIKIADQPWAMTELGATASDDTWVQWRYQFEATSGSHLAARARLRPRRQLQTDVPSTPEPSGATGYHYRSINVA